MILNKYGVDLVLVQNQHIELIRVWRNDPKISNHMFFKSHITTEMQQRWFNSINNDLNFYFLVCPGKDPIGLISISSIDYEHDKAFAGLFIYNDNFLGTDIPVRSSLCLLDVFFSYTSIDKLYAKVRESNLVADLYNTSLGFERVKKIELGQGYEYELVKEKYFKKAKNLRNAAAKIYGAKTTITFEDNDFEQALKKKFIDSLPNVYNSNEVAKDSTLEII